MQLARFFAISAMTFCTALAWSSSAYCVQSYTGGTYSENFDSTKLSKTSGSANWDDYGTALPGWALRTAGDQGTMTPNTQRDAGPGPNHVWSSPTTYTVNRGNNQAQGFYSYGADDADDRALGLLESPNTGTGGDREILLLLSNNTSRTLTQFTLTYDGEQWRYGGASASISNVLVFDYTITNANAVITEGDYTDNWHLVLGLNFNSLTLTGSPRALDGNTNHVVGITATVAGIVWQPGQWLSMRWWSNNDEGNDQGLAIDNLTFVAVPELGSFSLMLCGMLGLWIVRKR